MKLSREWVRSRITSFLVHPKHTPHPASRKCSDVIGCPSVTPPVGQKAHEDGHCCSVDKDISPTVQLIGEGFKPGVGGVEYFLPWHVIKCDKPWVQS